MTSEHDPAEKLRAATVDLVEQAESLLHALDDARRCGTHHSRYVEPSEHYLRRAIAEARSALRDPTS